MEILQATDIRIASENAKFGLQEAKWGLFPLGGSTVRLPRQMPYCMAMEVLLTGSLIDAEEALRIGFINRIVPMNYRLVGRELKYILNNSEAKALIYEKEFADTVYNALWRLIHDALPSSKIYGRFRMSISPNRGLDRGQPLPYFFTPPGPCCRRARSCGQKTEFGRKRGEAD